MIADARVLQPEFVPREVRHRSNKVDILTNSLEPVTDGDSGETSMIFGPSGVGKTCISRFVLDRLRENTIDIETQYVNAWEDHSRFKLLYRILEGVGKTLDIHRQSTPTDELLERLREYDDTQYVVIIDEVDQLEDKSLLYELYHVSNLTMVLIGNREEELFTDLDDRLASRLTSCSRIRFEPYTQNELISILQDRVRWGLKPDVIKDKHVAMIADAAAGDARKAIGILRQSAKAAHRGPHEEIHEKLITDAIPEATSEIRQQSLSKLTSDQRQLYEIVEDSGGIAPGDLYSKYTEQVSDPVTQRMMRNHLNKMQHYNLITATGETRSRIYKVIN